MYLPAANLDAINMCHSLVPLLAFFFFKLILLILLYIDISIHVSLNISIVNLYILNAETQ